MFFLLFYNVIYFILIFFSFLKVKLTQKFFQNRIILVFLIITLLIIIIIRDPNLPDYKDYIDAFKFNADRFEPTWYIIREISKIFNSYYFLFAIYGFLSIIFTLKAILSESKVIIFSIIVWLSYIFIIQDLIQIRQGVASALFLLSVKYINEKAILKYFFINIIGFLFHYSAIIAFPIYFINNRILKDKVLFFIIPFSLVLFYSNYGIINLLMNIPNHFVNSLLLARIETLDKTSEMIIFNGRTIILVIYIYILLFNIKKIREKWKNSIIYLKILIFSISILIILFPIPDVAMRFSIFLSITEIITIPSIYYLIKNKLLARSIIIFTSIILFINYMYRFIL